jgi:hypothetical protein
MSAISGSGCWSLRPRPAWKFSQNRQDHGDVVRRERPDHVFFLANPSDMEPVAGDVLDLAQMAAMNQIKQLPDERMILQKMADHQDAALVFREMRQRMALRSRQSERLLDKHMLAGPQRGSGVLDVQHGRRSHRDAVARPVVQNLGEGPRRERRILRENSNATSELMSQTAESAPSSARLRTIFWPHNPQPTAAIFGTSANSFENTPSPSTCPLVRIRVCLQGAMLHLNKPLSGCPRQELTKLRRIWADRSLPIHAADLARPWP